jgi:5-formyltetrahydrofolate cyclo-ligase
VIPPGPDPLQAAKPSVRAAALARRDAMPAAERATASAAIADLVDQHVLAGLAAGAVVALYYPKASEVDTAGIVAHATRRGLALAYPRTERDRRLRALSFHRATPAELAPGVFGLREPGADAPEVAVGDLAAIFVPGIAFDATGHRLGWGRGHYDATLTLARSVPSIGLAFTCQIVPRVPADTADVPVHLVVTQAGVMRAP